MTTPPSTDGTAGAPESGAPQAPSQGVAPGRRGRHPDHLGHIPRARWQSVLRRTGNRTLLANAIAQFSRLTYARQVALLSNPAVDDALQSALVAHWMEEARQRHGWMPLHLRSALRQAPQHAPALLRRLWAIAPASWQRDLLDIPAMPREIVQRFLLGMLDATPEMHDGALSVESSTKVRAALAHPGLPGTLVLRVLDREAWRRQVGAEALTSPSLDAATRRQWLRRMPVPYTWQPWGQPFSEHVLRLPELQRTWDIRSLARVALLHPSVRRLASPGEPWPDAVVRLVVRHLGVRPSMGAEENELPAVLARLLAMGAVADREVVMMFTRLATAAPEQALQFLDDHARAAQMAPTMTMAAREGLDRLRGVMTGVLLTHANAEVRLTAIRSLQPSVVPGTPARRAR